MSYVPKLQASSVRLRVQKQALSLKWVTYSSEAWPGCNQALIHGVGRGGQLEEGSSTTKEGLGKTASARPGDREAGATLERRCIMKPDLQPPESGWSMAGKRAEGKE